MINIIDPEKFIKENLLQGPVTSSQYFLGKSYNPHPQGMLSEEIFGIEGSPERKKSYSWIELGCTVINPVLYDILCKRIEKKLDKLLSGEEQYDFDSNGFLTPVEDGPINGMESLYNNRYKLRFRPGDEVDGTRNKLIEVMMKNIKQGTFFMDKLIIIPPDFRPVSILEEKNEVRPDEINEIYQKIIILSNQVSSVSGSLYDILTYRMQLLLRDLLELVRVKIAKKEGMIRKLMLGKRVDFSARTVISPGPTLKLGEVGIPLRIVSQIFEPNILYGLVNSRYAHTIPKEFHDEVKKFLGKESVIGMDI